jgi:hypothetical protein
MQLSGLTSCRGQVFSREADQLVFALVHPKGKGGRRGSASSQVNLSRISYQKLVKYRKTVLFSAGNMARYRNAKTAH